MVRVFYQKNHQRTIYNFSGYIMKKIFYCFFIINIFIYAINLEAAHKQQRNNAAKQTHRKIGLFDLVYNALNRKDYDSGLAWQDRENNIFVVSWDIFYTWYKKNTESTANI